MQVFLSNLCLCCRYLKKGRSRTILESLISLCFDKRERNPNHRRSRKRKKAKAAHLTPTTLASNSRIFLSVRKRTRKKNIMEFLIQDRFESHKNKSIFGFSPEREREIRQFRMFHERKKVGHQGVTSFPFSMSTTFKG